MSQSEALGSRKEVQLSQGIIRYRECGSGEPLVFIHGALVNGDLWYKVVPRLAQHYRCIVPDLPLGSHEIAAKAEADLTPPGLAKLISDFIEALDLEAVTLIGNDTGGALCQLVITRYPQRIARLILTNCDAFKNFPPVVFRPLVWGARVPGFVALLGRVLQSKFLQKSLLAVLTKYPTEAAIRQSFFRPVATDKAIQRDVRKLLRGVSNRYTLEAATRFGSFDKPVLLAWGSQDYFFTRQYAERLTRAFPNARLEFIEEALTFVSLDQPERLVELIEAFIGLPVSAR